jgi:hypothetical protein
MHGANMKIIAGEFSGFRRKLLPPSSEKMKERVIRRNLPLRLLIRSRNKSPQNTNSISRISQECPHMDHCGA